MKFTAAWSEVLNQNVSLKVGLGVCTLCTFVLCVTVVRLALRDPLIIDRGCLSNAVQGAQTKQTADEIENFVRFALSKRFDSDVTDARIFLGDEEYAYRLKEQDDLTRKGMRQKVYPVSVKAGDKGVLADADRILGVGNVRSNVPFSLNIQVTATSRTAANPYGLLLQRVSQVKEETKP